MDKQVKLQLIETLEMIKDVSDHPDEAYEDYDVSQDVKVKLAEWLTTVHARTLVAFKMDDEQYQKAVKRMHWREHTGLFEEAKEMIYIECASPPSLETLKRRIISYWEIRERNAVLFLETVRVPGATTVQNRMKQERYCNGVIQFHKVFLSIVKSTC